MTTAAACVRCGDFLEPARVVVEGVPLCSACLDPKAVAGDVFAVFPPGRVVAQRLGYACSYFVVGILIGVALGLAIAASLGARGSDLILGAFLGGVGGLVLAEIAFFIRGFSRQHHLGHAFWKKKLEEQFKLEQAPPGTFALVIYSPRFVRLTNLKIPIEVGLLAEGEKGVVFVGSRGARIAVRNADVAAVAVERLYWFPPRTCVRFDLRSGTQHWVCCIEKETFGANKKETEALAARVRARLGGGSGGAGPA